MVIPLFGFRETTYSGDVDWNINFHTNFTIFTENAHQAGIGIWLAQIDIPHLAKHCYRLFPAGKIGAVIKFGYYDTFFASAANSRQA